MPFSRRDFLSTLGRTAQGAEAGWAIARRGYTGSWSSRGRADAANEVSVMRAMSASDSTHSSADYTFVEGRAVRRRRQPTEFG